MFFTRLIFIFFLPFLIRKSWAQIKNSNQNLDDLMAFIKLSIKNENNPDSIISNEQDDEETIESRIKNINIIIDRFDRILNFMESNYENINLDGLFGIRIAEGFSFFNLKLKHL